MNKSDFHPSFQGTWTCVVLRAADGSFNGFKIESVQRGQDIASAVTSVIPVLGTGLALDAGAQWLTRTSGSFGVMRASRFDECLNPAKGSVVFDISLLGDGTTPGANWAIGLQRYRFLDYSHNDGETQMADFVLFYNQLNGTLEYREWTYDRRWLRLTRFGSREDVTLAARVE